MKTTKSSAKLEPLTEQQRLRLLSDELDRKKIQAKIKWELPHKYGYKPYKWTNEFNESTNRLKFLVAGNQASKSSTMIKHNILLATDKSLWPEFFPKRIGEGQQPYEFWYIYPDGNVLAKEIKKWESECLPRGSMRESATYGWKWKSFRNEIVGVEFRSGVTIHFLTWRSQFQSSTIDMVSIDEELPNAHKMLPELQMRLTRWEGRLNTVFTATIGQKFFYDIIERRGERDEIFPHAAKWQISIEHDCRYYADGTPSPFTAEKVAEIKASMGTQREIDKRVHGKFINTEGLKYPEFEYAKNVKPIKPIPDGWLYYAGIDVGSGGKDGHPSAISIVAVAPNFRKARLVRFWKGNKRETTTAVDVLNKYNDLRSGLTITQCAYDFSSAEFKMHAARTGIAVVGANKKQEYGTELLNMLFKNEMLDLDELENVHELTTELENLKLEAKKQKAEDDACFSEDTLVMTPSGEKKISLIKPGDYVITRSGPKRVIATSIKPSTLFEFTLPNGQKIECTETHKFFSNDSFVPINCVSKTDSLLEYSEWIKSEESKRSCLTGSPSADILIRQTTPTAAILAQAVISELKECKRFIKRFGNQLTDLFQRTHTFITETAISLTTPLKTWNALTPSLISLNTRKNDTTNIQSELKNIWKASGLSPKRGTRLRLAANGIGKTELLGGSTSRPSKSRASFAVSRLRPRLTTKNFAQTIVSLKIGEIQVSTTLIDLAKYVGRCSSLTATTNEELAHAPVKNALEMRPLGPNLVYNITVEHAHEYFANGVLVANCDSLRYACSTNIPWDVSGLIVSDEFKDKLQTFTREGRHPRDNGPAFDYEIKASNEYDFDNEIDEYNELLGEY